jgi:hypothetical protein
VGRISRVSEIHRLHFDKIKGTLVNFNDLEHVLDDVPGIGAWQIELRKHNDDPLDCDELILHVHRTGRSGKDELRRIISDRFLLATEISPNRVEFHEAGELRAMQGVGTALKEAKIVDHRPAQSSPIEPTEHENVLTESRPH